MRNRFYFTILAFVSVLAVLTGCSGSSRFVVEGEVDQCFSKVRSVDINEENVIEGTQYITSVQIENGRFRYVGKADKMKIYSVTLETLEGEFYGATFVGEPSVVRIHFMEDGSTVDGGVITDSFMEFEDSVNDSYAYHQAELESAYLDNDLDAADRIQNEIFEEQRVLYNLAYETNTDNAVGLVAMLGMIYSLPYEPDEVLEYWEMASPTLKKNKYLKDAIGQVRSAANAAASDNVSE